MIVQPESIDDWVSFNIGRPSMFTDEDCLMWQKFFTYIETCPYEIVINGAYDICREIAFSMKRYGGGGYKFMFMTKDQETCDIVERECLATIGRVPERGYVFNGKFSWMPVDTCNLLVAQGKGEIMTYEEWCKNRPLEKSKSKDELGLNGLLSTASSTTVNHPSLSKKETIQNFFKKFI